MQVQEQREALLQQAPARRKAVREALDRARRDEQEAALLERLHLQEESRRRHAAAEKARTQALEHARQLQAEERRVEHQQRREQDKKRATGRQARAGADWGGSAPSRAVAGSALHAWSGSAPQSALGGLKASRPRCQAVPTLEKFALSGVR